MRRWLVHSVADRICISRRPRTAPRGVLVSEPHERSRAEARPSDGLVDPLDRDRLGQPVCRCRLEGARTGDEGIRRGRATGEGQSLDHAMTGDQGGRQATEEGVAAAERVVAAHRRRAEAVSPSRYDAIAPTAPRVTMAIEVPRARSF